MKKILLVVTLFMLAATLVACGGTEEGTKEPLVHAQGVSDTEIIVGNTAVNDGPLGFVGAPFLAGMETYFSMVNEAGGVLGRDIRLIHYSDGFDGETGLTHTQTLVEVDKVFAMVGHFGTPTVGATAEYLETLGVPRVYYGTGTSLVYEEDVEGSASFPVQPVYEYEGEMMAARSIDSFDAQKIGLIYTANENGFEIKTGLERVASAQGVTVVSAQVSGTDFASAALTIIDADVDVVVLGMNQWSVVSALLELFANGNTKPAIMSYVAADASVIAQVKQVATAFDVYANAWVNTIDDEGNITPEFELYQTEIVKQYPEYENNSFAIAGWIAAMVFVKGLERMDADEAISWENFIEAMEESVFNYGLGSPLDFTGGKRVGTQIMSFLQMKVEDEVGYFEIAESMEAVDQILARQE
ncbi:ABC transporter substrate-binding protein [Hujiaoplasma nucleasis]|uniref:ABC transporter substrate-binding protein n=1 Tax=Hujiaoplasma nucleasis TaxID=2725268 RepID=A0A7L6N3G5_9MOLU|nr:ABC transporter substrate-binding protein [Hujiaoplasma nucleasis]QLY40091.1 ABC transporter substrate-binding protein [Hujiaoplasma nucleasis]